MGAGQIGGIATLLDIDFNNAAGFLGVETEPTEAQYIVHFLSHALMFCVGSLLEAHVVLTPASCIFGERYKFQVFGGTHKFIEHAGVSRVVDHLCIHRGYNHTQRWERCNADNLALLVLNKQFSFHTREVGSDFVINRVRYGVSGPTNENRYTDTTCRFYGWGSRRNGYLIPLLVRLRRMSVTLVPPHKCVETWNHNEKYLCIQEPACKSEKFGALCPDDVGSLLVCSGYAQGMMISRLVDRPCGVGFLDLTLYTKFLTCGVDDSRDVIDHDDFMSFEIPTKPDFTNPLITPPILNKTTKNPHTITEPDGKDGDGDQGDDGSQGEPVVDLDRDNADGTRAGDADAAFYYDR